MCHRQKRLFTLDHIEKCDQLSGCERIRTYANKLKEKPLLDWDKQERFDAIAAFALLTIQIQNLAAQKEITLVQSKPVEVYVQKGNSPGKPKKITQVGKSNHKINRFFALVPRGTRAI